MHALDFLDYVFKKHHGEIEVDFPCTRDEMEVIMTRDVQYEKEKKDELTEAQKQLVKDKLEEFVSDICIALEWDLLLYYNKDNVKSMISDILSEY